MLHNRRSCTMSTSMITALQVAALLCALRAAADAIDPQAQSGADPLGRGLYKDSFERIAEQGYAVERHNTTTEDGYILTMFRLPRPRVSAEGSANATRPVVFVLHGLFGSSDDWLTMGANNGLPFQLADAGFDVWLGNARGNFYSRAHTRLSPLGRAFWRFSWDEIGRLDVPAMIEYALAAGGGTQRTLHYVGHSQGTTAFFVWLAERPQDSARIRTAHMLAPVAFINHTTLRVLVQLGPVLGHQNAVSAALSSREFLPQNEAILSLLYTTCALDSLLLQLCTPIKLQFEGEGTWKNLSAVQLAAGTNPAGVSTDQVLHYSQLQQSGYFRKFDFGSVANERMYAQPQPPDYAVERIRARLHLWYGDNDEYAAVVDVLRLAALLPDRVLHRIPDPAWGHFDFLQAAQLRSLLNDPLIAVLRDYEAGEAQRAT